MEIFIVWIGFSFLVGWFWQSKGLSFSSGVVWSVILSPIGGFAIGVNKAPDRKQQEAQRLAIGDARKCPFCAEIIKLEAIVCRYCGRDVPAPQQPAPASNPEAAFDPGI